MNREDLYFPGNRRGIELAAMTNPSGTGLLLGGADMTVDLENQKDGTIVSHLALVPGQDVCDVNNGENVDFSARIRADTVTNFSGTFTLLPLRADWPKSLVRWFDSPGKRANVKKPFFRSYDQ